MAMQFILSNGDGIVHVINKLQVVCNDNSLLDNGVSKNEPKFAFCLIFSLAHQLCYYSWYICNAIIWHFCTFKPDCCYELGCVKSLILENIMILSQQETCYGYEWYDMCQYNDSEIDLYKHEKEDNLGLHFQVRFCWTE